MAEDASLDDFLDPDAGGDGGRDGGEDASDRADAPGNEDDTGRGDGSSDMGFGDGSSDAGSDDAGDAGSDDAGDTGRGDDAGDAGRGDDSCARSAATRTSDDANGPRSDASDRRVGSESVVDPEGARCAACGRSVSRRWRRDGALVCGDCVEW